MEFNFSDLRAKEVINTQDGRKLGRVCDIALCYPENRWIGIIVPGGRWSFKKSELFIELRNIVKIGEDVILVNVGMPKKENGKPDRCSPSHGQNGCGVPRNERNFEDFE